MTTDDKYIAQDALEALAAGAPDWLAANRRGAYELYREALLPERALHRWRYVDPARLVPKDLALNREAPLEQGPDLPDDAEASVLVTRGPGGHVVRLGAEARRAGVVALDLERAAREREDLVRPLLGAVEPAGETPFAALNAALWSGGLFLSVPRGTRLAKPIRLATDAAPQGLSLPRNLIVFGEEAEATVLEELTGREDGEARPMVHRANEVVVGAGARARLVFVQELDARAVAASTTRVRLERDGFFQQLFAAFGGALAKTDLFVRAVGPGAETQVLGAVFGGGKRQFDNHIVIEHEAPDTTSNLDVRVALEGRAKAATTGRLYIAGDAARSSAYQENRNLLLSADANAVSIPELEILTDDVAAKHGATVGPIDEDQLYYLRSRGLDAREAAAMVVSGFFEALLAKAPEGLAQDVVRRRVAARLFGAEGRR